MGGGGSRTIRKGREMETRGGEHKPSACRLINDSTRQLRRRLEKIIPLPSFVSETFTSPNSPPSFLPFFLPSILSFRCPVRYLISLASLAAPVAFKRRHVRRFEYTLGLLRLVLSILYYIMYYYIIFARANQRLETITLGGFIA